MDYNYILLTDSRFISYAVSELRELLGLEGRIKTMALGKGVYLAKLDALPESASERLRNATFSYGVVPVMEISEKMQTDDELVESVSHFLSKDETFRVEVVSLGAKRGESAKSAEVKIGQALESKGFKASLTEPKRVVYIIVGEGIVVTASDKSERLPDITLDHFRLENRSHDSLNRAEIKIKEAFESFGLSGKKLERCLDVGASPGGWTNFLVKRGARVVAIDRGVLEYGKLATADFNVITDLKDYSDRHTVLHIRANISDEADLPFAPDSFDLVAVDTNTDYMESSRIANLLSRYLRHGGFLIMTLKLPKISDAGRIHTVKELLAKEYKVERVKKLHHNRMELTLFATRL
ncbi:MAG: methyltransferase domain-containing protein [Candidatus Micrarchaeota archaeon]|nr:methyltransferase domain-containing protein [Candidatus Micrarchaeota archaeon]